MKALIVDDMLVDRKVLVQILSKYAECETADSAVVAFEKIVTSLENNDPYDLICLDILMPKIDGEETIQKIRRLETIEKYKDLKKPKILIVTSSEERAETLKKMPNGPHGYIIKPINRASLLDFLNKFGLVSTA